MESFWEQLAERTGFSADLLSNMASTVFAIAVVMGIRAAVLAIVRRRDSNLQRIYQWRRISAWVAIFLAVPPIAAIWVSELRSIGTVIGLTSAGIAVALRDPLVNMVGWMFIVSRRPFELGDRIEIGDRRGDVVDQRLFDFSLMEIGAWVDGDDQTGRVIRVPNGKVFTELVTSYKGGYMNDIWNEVAIVITFESNWEAAKVIVEEISRKHGERHAAEVERLLRRRATEYLITGSRDLRPKVISSIVDIGVQFTIRYLCEAGSRRATAQVIYEEVLRAFAKREDIDFAYPTQRFYNNALEGKAGARAWLPGPQPRPPTHEASGALGESEREHGESPMTHEDPPAFDDEEADADASAPPSSTDPHRDRPRPTGTSH